jgi:steroid delta-isomerase-like uncharacterized protein
MKKSFLAVPLIGLLCFSLSCKEAAVQGVTEEEAKVLTDGVLKIFNEGDMAFIAEVFAPEVVAHTSTFPEDFIGHEGIKNWIESSRAIFPDLNMTFDEIIIKGNKIVTVWTLTGTNTGSMSMPYAVPPTGKKVRVTGLAIDDVQNGKIVKETVVYNVLELMMQMGFTLSPPLPGE